MNNNFFSFFTPKSGQYFDLLSEMADAVFAIAKLTEECIQAKSHSDIVKYSTQIREQKQIGSKVQNKVITELHNTFVTPFDREDISNLSMHMKDTIDHISSCAKRIMLYSPKYMPEDASTLAALVREAAELLRKAVNKLSDLKKNPQSISKICKQLSSIESQSDEVYENFLIKLFAEEKDAVEVVKLKDILHELEFATDSAEHVGKIIRTIVVKYA